MNASGETELAMRYSEPTLESSLNVLRLIAARSGQAEREGSTEFLCECDLGRQIASSSSPAADRVPFTVRLPMRHPLDTVRRLAEVCRRAEIDVVHAYGATAYVHAMAAGMVATIPALLYSNMAEGFDESPAWLMLTARLMGRRVPLVIAHSPAECDRLLAEWGVKPERIAYLPPRPAGSAPDASGAQVADSYYREVYWRARHTRARSLHDRAKSLLATGLAMSGATGLAMRRHERSLKILTYHRVLPLHEALRYPFHAMVMARDHFDAQMAHLKRAYHVLPLGDALKRLQAGDLPPRAVAVTFDDGYLDNYVHAWPILKKYEIPATLFVVSGVLDRTTMLWWDAVSRAVPDVLRRWNQGWGRDHGVPHTLQGLLEESARAADPMLASQRLCEFLNGQPRAQRQGLIETLLSVGSLEHLNRDLMLTWEQVREMRRGGWEIGAHTVTHAFVDELDDAGAQAEIQTSIRRVEEELKTAVRIFSYPRGRVGDHVKPVLRRIGVEAAVSTELGQNQPGVDPYHLRRFDMGLCRTPGAFNPAVCDAEINGLFQLLRRA